MITRPSSRKAALFPVNVWPPMVDVVTLVLAAFVLLMIMGLVAQRMLVTQLSEREAEMRKLKEDKARIEKKLKSLASVGMVDVEGDKVIMQGEILFDSGSDQLNANGIAFVEKLATPLKALLEAEPEQTVMVGGHTDDVTIHNERFDSNWELSAARAVSVARKLMAMGLNPSQVVAAGFGPYHPRVQGTDDATRRLNRRIEVLLIPTQAVTSK